MVEISRFSKKRGSGDTWHDDTFHVTHSMVCVMVRGMHEEDEVVANSEW